MFGFGKKKSDEGEATKTMDAPAKAEAADIDLKVKLKERKGCAAVLQVQIPAAGVAEKIEEAFLQIQSEAKLPGFRVGKVPLDLVKKNYQHRAEERALDQLLRETAFESIRREKLEAVTLPAVDKVEWSPGKPLKYELTVECAPEFDLKEYKGLALTRKVKSIDDADVEKRLNELREHNARLIDAEGAAAGPTHFVVVNYTGRLDGKPVEGGQAENQLIEMAAPQTLTGFTEGLQGAKAGETKQIPVQWPEDHPNKELAGKTLQFDVTVIAVKEKQLPAADDEFAKDVGSKDLADLKAALRRALETEQTRAHRQDLEKQVIDKLLEYNIFEVPAALVNERAQALTDRMKGFLMQRGATEENWKAGEAKMKEKNRPEAERQVRLSYVLARAGEKEKIEVLPSEIDQAIETSVQNADPARREEIRRWLESRRSNLKDQLWEKKIFDLLIDNANVTDAAA